MSRKKVKSGSEERKYKEKKTKPERLKGQGRVNWIKRKIKRKDRRHNDDKKGGKGKRIRK